MGKPLKKKPIKFDDIGHKVKLGLADGVVKRTAKLLGDYSGHGSSYYVVECPFAHVISMPISGHCGAVVKDAQIVKL